MWTHPWAPKRKSTRIALVVLTIAGVLAILVFVIPMSYGQRLHRAVMRNDIQLVEQLLDESPQLLELRAHYLGMTPLHSAAHAKKTEVLELLIRRGADVNATCRLGNYPEIWCNPLHVAAINGHLEGAKLLIKAGTDVNWKAEGGETPLDYAVKNGHWDMARLLELHGAIRSR
jgi:ankyrin repeat protein